MLKESTLVKILKIGLFACAFVPLIIFSQFLSPFHFGKVIIFRSLVEAMLVFYIILVLKNKIYLPKVNKIFWTFLAFTGAFTITTLTSSQFYQSFWGTLERMGGLWTFWHYFIFFIILISVFRKREDWIWLSRLVVGVGILSALYGFGQKTNISFFIGSGDRARIFGTIGNAALFAGYQLLVFFLSLTLFFKKDNRLVEKWLYGAAVILCGTAVMMTAVRGSLLALGVSVLIFALFYVWHFYRSIAKKFTLGLAGIALILILGALVLRNTSLVKNSGYLKRVTDFSLSNYTVETRFWAWQAGLKGWSSSVKTVAVGWGPENFNIPFSINFNPKFFTGLGAETLFDRAHNMFVEVLVTMGLIGFLAYVSIFAAIFYCLRKIYKRGGNHLLAGGLTALFVVYIIHNSFIFDTSANFITFFMLLGFIYFLNEEPTLLENKNSGTPVIKNPVLVSFLGIVLAVGAVILIYKTNIIPAEANYAATRAIILEWNNSASDIIQQPSNLTQVVEKYKEAMVYDVPGKYEIRNRFAQAMLNYSGSLPLTTPGYTDAIKLAIQEVQKNADDFPLDYLPQLYLSRLNIVLGKSDPKSPYNDEALKHSLKALELSPTFVRTYYEVAQGYMNKDDYATAAKYFQKAADLNPDVSLSYWYLGMAQLQQGDLKLAQKTINTAFEKGYSASETDYLRLINTYLKNNDFTDIALVYQKLVQIAPDNPQYHASLAVAYAKIGKIDEAVAEARKAASIDSTFQPEAIRFVQSLGRSW